MITRLFKNILLLSSATLGLHAMTETELIKIRVTYLREHSATFSTYQITEMFKETVLIARKHNLNVPFILTELKNYAQIQVNYYSQKLNRKIKKPGELKFGIALIGMGIAAVLSAYTLEGYATNTHRDWLSNIGTIGLLMCMIGIPWTYDALFPHWRDRYYKEREEDETSLNNYTTFIEQIHAFSKSV